MHIAAVGCSDEWEGGGTGGRVRAATEKPACTFVGVFSFACFLCSASHLCPSSSKEEKSDETRARRSRGIRVYLSCGGENPREKEKFFFFSPLSVSRAMDPIKYSRFRDGESSGCGAMLVVSLVLFSLVDSFLFFLSSLSSSMRVVTVVSEWSHKRTKVKTRK